MPNDLLDLINEGKQEKRKAAIAKAATKVKEEKSRKPPEGGPPIRSDIYQQLEWKALSLTLVTISTHCRCCNTTYEAPNPTIFVERYHRRHGRHLVEAHNFSLLSREELQTLPRKQETIYRTALYCHHCFQTQQEPLCLEPQIQQLSNSLPDSLPCLPQEWATPLLPQLWSNTLLRTGNSTNQLSPDYDGQQKT